MENKKYDDYELFSTLVRFSQNELFDFLKKEIIKYYPRKNIFWTEEFMYVFGGRVGLVAHLDTVHAQPVQTLIHDEKQDIYWSPEGLGADDRAGVFSILKILERGFRPTIIFCTEEEIGGVGAYYLASCLPNNKHVDFLIELDRQGRNDSVYYDLDNKKFERFINHFGFKTKEGIFSDISILAPTWKIPAVNLSVGYYNEHTFKEYWKHRECLITINKTCAILNSKYTREILKYRERVGIFDYGEAWRYSETEH